MSMRRRGGEKKNTINDRHRVIGPSNGLWVVSIQSSGWWWEMREGEEDQRRQQLMIVSTDEPLVDVEAEVWFNFFCSAY